MTSGLLAGCASTAPQRPNPTLAPPLPTPSPLSPGQAQPSVPPPIPPNPSIPLPPNAGVSPVPTVPATPDQNRVQTVALRLYQANPWLKLRPQWIVRPGDTPGMANQGDQYVLISEGLVHSASDGQLAAVMSLQLADLAAARQKMIRDAERDQRNTATRPDFLHQHDHNNSAVANLELAEVAKRQDDPRDLRRHEQPVPPVVVDPPSLARQLLTQAGYGAQELEGAAQLLQRFPPVGAPARR